MLTQMDVGQLTTRPPFSDLFRMHPDTLAGLTASMKERGFDQATPIVAWDGTVIEGHTRLQAAKNAGLGWVWVFNREFADDDKALVYAIEAQSNRRNLDAGELLRCIARLDSIKPRGGDRRSKTPRGGFDPGNTAEETAALVGVGRGTVERARKVLADDEARQAVERGEASINKAYELVREKERHQKEAAPPVAVPIVLPTLPASEIRGIYTVAEWKKLSQRDREFLLTEHPAQTNSDFNRTNENVELALWTWNPVTGCLHECPYCYARDIAARFYPQRFVPTFVPGRLHAARTKKGAGGGGGEPRREERLYLLHGRSVRQVGASGVDRRGIRGDLKGDGVELSLPDQVPAAAGGAGVAGERMVRHHGGSAEPRGECGAVVPGRDGRGEVAELRAHAGTADLHVAGDVRLGGNRRGKQEHGDSGFPASVGVGGASGQAGSGCRLPGVHQAKPDKQAA